MVSDEALANSFAHVKKDIRSLQANILELSGKQAELFEMLQEIRNSLVKTKSSARKKK